MIKVQKNRIDSLKRTINEVRTRNTDFKMLLFKKWIKANFKIQTIYCYLNKCFLTKIKMTLKLYDLPKTKGLCRCNCKYVQKPWYQNKNWNFWRTQIKNQLNQRCFWPKIRNSWPRTPKRRWVWFDVLWAWRATGKT